MESIPWGDVLQTGGAAGMLAVLFWMLATGRLVTRREAETYLARAEKAEGNVERLIATVADQTAISKLQKATIEAALKANAQVGDDS